MTAKAIADTIASEMYESLRGDEPHWSALTWMAKERWQKAARDALAELAGVRTFNELIGLQDSFEEFKRDRDVTTRQFYDLQRRAEKEAPWIL